eukprot:1148168-Pelagomonas_calceolata.AAC.3
MARQDEEGGRERLNQPGSSPWECLDYGGHAGFFYQNDCLILVVDYGAFASLAAAQMWLLPHRGRSKLFIRHGPSGSFGKRPVGNAQLVFGGAVEKAKMINVTNGRVLSGLYNCGLLMHSIKNGQFVVPYCILKLSPWPRLRTAEQRELYDVEGFYAAAEEVELPFSLQVPGSGSPARSSCGVLWRKDWGKLMAWPCDILCAT